MEELDKNFESLVQSEALLSLTDPGKMNALKALVNKNVPGSASIESSALQKVETSMQVRLYACTCCFVQKFSLVLSYSKVVFPSLSL